MAYKLTFTLNDALQILFSILPYVEYMHITVESPFKMLDLPLKSTYYPMKIGKDTSPVSELGSLLLSSV